MAMRLLGVNPETPTSINLSTIKNVPIDNEQYREIIQQELDNEIRFEPQFKSSFQGSPSKMYNCHGLTFANRRTGVFKDSAIALILNEEYIEIKDYKAVIEGDVAVYFDSESGCYTHSAIVIKRYELLPENIISPMRLLSKTRCYKEVVHEPINSPYPGEIKYFRINHESPRIFE